LVGEVDVDADPPRSGSLALRRLERGKMNENRNSTDLSFGKGHCENVDRKIAVRLPVRDHVGGGERSLEGGKPRKSFRLIIAGARGDADAFAPHLDLQAMEFPLAEG